MMFSKIFSPKLLLRCDGLHSCHYTKSGMANVSFPNFLISGNVLMNQFCGFDFKQIPMVINIPICKTQYTLNIHNSQFELYPNLRMQQTKAIAKMVFAL